MRRALCVGVGLSALVSLMCCPARSASPGCMPFIAASVLTFMPWRRAMLHSDSPRRTTCTCAWRVERPGRSTWAAASSDFLGQLGKRPGDAHVGADGQGPVGHIVELAQHIGRGVELLGNGGDRVAALDRVVRNAHALFIAEQQQVVAEHVGHIDRHQAGSTGRWGRWRSDGTPGSARTSPRDSCRRSRRRPSC